MVRRKLEIHFPPMVKIIFDQSTMCPCVYAPDRLAPFASAMWPPTVRPVNELAYRRARFQIARYMYDTQFFFEWLPLPQKAS